MLHRRPIAAFAMSVCALALATGCSPDSSPAPIPSAANTAPLETTGPEALALADVLTQRIRSVLSSNDQARWSDLGEELARIATQQSEGAGGLNIAEILDSAGVRLPYPPFEVSAPGESTWCVGVPSDAVATALQGDFNALAYIPVQGDCSSDAARQEEAIDAYQRGSSLEVARKAGKAISAAIAQLLQDATDLGTAPNDTATWVQLSGNAVTVAFSGPVQGSPATTTAPVSVPSGVSLVSSGHAAGRVTAAGPIWCVAIAYRDTTAVFDQAGWRSSASQCTSEGIAR